MAKVGIIQRGWRGKAGGYSYAKGENGETIARASVTPANPRTTPMMIQRVIFATVANARKAFEQLISQSFEGKSAKEAKRLFTSINVKNFRALYKQEMDTTPDNMQIAFTAKGVSQVIPNMYVISKGSIPSRAYGMRTDASQIQGVTNACMLNMSLLSASEFSTGETAEGRTPILMTPKTVLKYIFGITKPTQQLNCVDIHINVDAVEPEYITGGMDAGDVIYPTLYKCMRLVPSGTEIFDGTAFNVGYKDEHGVFHWTLDPDDTLFHLLFDTTKSDYKLFENILNAMLEAGGEVTTQSLEIRLEEHVFPITRGINAASLGMFVSEKTARGMKCESCRMATCELDVYSNGLTMENAIASFKSAGTEFESDNTFLEQGTDNTSLPTD